MQADARGKARLGHESPISVIICAFTVERWDDLMRAIESVRRQTRPPREIILIVDHSPELQRRAEAELDGIEVLANSGRPGLSGARQAGAAAASGSILAFLDDDAVADPGWAEELEHAHDDELALGAGGQVVPDWVQPPPRWFPPEFNWVVGCHHRGMSHDVTRIRNPIGANMSIRKDVMQRTGDFEQVFGRTGAGAVLGGTCDETEFCIRAQRLHPGRYWVYRPAARVRHTVHPRRGTWSYFVRRCRLEGRSKAILTGLAGTEAGLLSERAYVRSVLPRAVARELCNAAGGELTAVGRAGAILAGLAITALEYGRIRLTIRLRGEAEV